MCNHKFIKVNDIRVCTKCGVTFTLEGKCVFDRRLIAVLRRKEKRDAKS